MVIDKVDGCIKEKNVNNLTLVSTDKSAKKYWQNTQNFGMGLKIW